MQLVFFVIVAIVGWLVLSKTVFGFRVYAVGGNDKAARISGIKVYNTKISAFIIMGFLAALSGILSLAFLPSGQAGRTGIGVELDVIAAAIVGGASLSGGEGTILGTILGVLIIGVLRNGLVLMGISPFWQETIIGLVIILAVGIDKWTSSSRKAVARKASALQHWRTLSAIDSQLRELTGRTATSAAKSLPLNECRCNECAVRQMVSQSKCCANSVPQYKENRMKNIRWFLLMSLLVTCRCC